MQGDPFMRPSFLTHASFRLSCRAFGLGGLAALLAILASGCGQAPARTTEKKAAEVVATTPITDQVIDYQDFTGRLDGLKTVDIRARVSGFVLSAPFKEGDLVHQGDLLFLIDPLWYQADLNLAAANLKVARADKNLQERIAARSRSLIGNGAVGQEEYETAVATAQKSQATVEAMDATQARAKLFVDWTRVVAPLSGRVSRRLVDPGNLVNADQTILTTIVSDNQLYAYFDVDERTYLNLVGPVSPGQSSMPSSLQFPVLMQLANEEQFSRSGIVDFIDNRVNATSGTIRMRAIFDNANGALRAGLFVRIRLPVGTPYQATLIPDEALLSDQGRKYVYVVDDKNEVVYRPVTPGQEIKGLRVITKGMAMGDRVIISGMQRVRAGSQVQVKMQDPPKPPEQPLAHMLTSKPGDKETGKPADKHAGEHRSALAQPGG
jgi:multidrug efflux system membrane fusion protein